MLQKLIDEKLVYENEIDREAKIIRIGSRKINYNIGESTYVPMEPDKGKEELILEYVVEAGDVVGLPYDIKCYDSERNETTAVFDFEVDWGDGSKDNITNSDIESKSKHTYTVAGTYEIKIKGTYEVLVSGIYDEVNSTYIYAENINKLVKVKQWGTTNLKNLLLSGITGLKEIASPTKSSFKSLECVYSGYCTGLTELPDNLFANCAKVIDFSYTFEYCESLTTIGNNIFANCSNATTFEKAFEGCISLTTIGDNTFTNCTNVEDFSYLFENFTSLTTIGNNTFANCSNATNYEGTFAGCSNLTTIGANTFIGCDKVENYMFTFADCSCLTGNAIPLWLKVPNGETNNYEGIPDGFSCFRRCTSLTDYEKIPYHWICGIE